MLAQARCLLLFGRMASINGFSERARRFGHWLIHRGVGRFVLALVILIVAARIALPYVLERYFDQAIEDLEGYTGGVGDVDLRLWKGAYRIEDIEILKDEGEIPVPFVAAGAIELTIDWRALFAGKVVSNVDIWEPVINFVEGPTDATEQTGAGVAWNEEIESTLPLQINRLTVHDGEVHYRDFHSEPHVDLFVDRLNVVARNLRSVRDRSKRWPASIRANAVVQRSGRLEGDVRLDPLAPQPEFDMNVQVERLRLQELNPALRAYANVDAEGGRIAVYTELRSTGGRIEGYVKPILQRVDIHDFGEGGDFLDRFGDAMASIAAEILENQPRDQVATRVVLRGRLDSPDVNIWKVVGGLLRNAFWEAFKHGIDRSL
jgi:hypothetical protein